MKKMSDIDKLIDSANELYERGNYLESGQMFENVLKIDPENLEALECLGGVYYIKNRYEELIKIQKIYAKIDNNIFSRIYAYEKIAYAYKELKKYSRALYYYHKILKILNRFLEEFQHDQDLEEAKVESLADLVDCWGLVDKKMKLEWYKRNYDFALEVGPLGYIKEAMEYLAIAYYSVKEYKKAIKFFEETNRLILNLKEETMESRVLGYIPESFFILSEMGDAYAKLNDKENAKHNYMKSKKILEELTKANYFSDGWGLELLAELRKKLNLI